MGWAQPKDANTPAKSNPMADLGRFFPSDRRQATRSSLYPLPTSYGEYQKRDTLPTQRRKIE